MTGWEVVGPLDPAFGWDGSRPFGDVPPSPDATGTVGGAFGCVDEVGDDRIRVVRDPLGLGKLFWARLGERILFAARPYRLVDRGCPFEEIRALPAGAEVLLHDTAGELRAARSAAFRAPRDDAVDEAEVSDHLAGVRRRLERYLSALAEEQQSDRVFVCVSGGLDSSGVLALARRHFGEVRAVSFDLERGGDAPSGDRRTARRLAEDLDVELLAVDAAEEELLDRLDSVLREAIDWRDFNVHAAAVNDVLARAISRVTDEGSGDERPLVLTGDLMNELVADYEPEELDGREYYRLPRLDRGRLRAILVRGLDTSHREIGPFAAAGLRLVQPYAVVAEEYLRLPASLLEGERAKRDLSRAVFGDLLPEYVYDRPKTRAQVGDSAPGRGVLDVFVRRGIGDAELRTRFAELHETETAALSGFIRAGRYRAGIPGRRD